MLSAVGVPFLFHSCKSFWYCVSHHRERFTMSSETVLHSAFCCGSLYSCYCSASCSGAMSFKVAWMKLGKNQSHLSIFQVSVCLEEPQQQKLLRECIQFFKFSYNYSKFLQVGQTTCSFLSDLARKHKSNFLSIAFLNASDSAFVSFVYSHMLFENKYLEKALKNRFFFLQDS